MSSLRVRHEVVPSIFLHAPTSTAAVPLTQTSVEPDCLGVNVQEDEHRQTHAAAGWC